MSLIDTNFEKAAKILAESEDDVLQAAGGKALTPIPLQNENPTTGVKTSGPWWQKTLAKSTQGGIFATSHFSNFSTTGTSNKNRQQTTTLFGQPPPSQVTTVQSTDVTSPGSFSSPKSSFTLTNSTTTIRTTNTESLHLFSSPKVSFSSKTAVTATSTVTNDVAGVFSSPKFNFALETSATNILSTNVASSNLFSSPKSVIDSEITSTTPQIQNTKVVSSVVFSSPKPSFDSETTASTVTNVASNLLNSPKSVFDFGTTSTTPLTQTATVVSSVLLGSTKAGGDLKTNSTTTQSSSSFSSPKSNYDLKIQPATITSTTATPFPVATSSMACILQTQTSTTTFPRTNTTCLNLLGTDNSSFSSNGRSQKNSVSTYSANATSTIPSILKSRVCSPDQEITIKHESRSSSRSSSSLSNSFFVKEEKLPEDFTLKEWDFDFSGASSRPKSRPKSEVPKIPENQQLTYSKKPEHTKNEQEQDYGRSFNRRNYITDIRRVTEDTKALSPVVPIKSMERQFEDLQISRNIRSDLSLVPDRNRERLYEEKRHVSANNVLSLEKRTDNRRFEANFIRNTQNFSPVYNIYETHNQSWHVNYTEPRHSQPIINNILVNVDSRFGLGHAAFPASSGGCGCRQIQCADRRCGCNKAGTSCHSGCLCSSRGRWCLNR